MGGVCRAMGVRTDVPFSQLTDKECLMQTTRGECAGRGEGRKRHEAGGKVFEAGLCPDCGGSRLSDAARMPKLRGISLDEACKMTLDKLVLWVAGVPGTLPVEMQPMAGWTTSFQYKKIKTDTGFEALKLFSFSNAPKSAG